MRVAFFQGVHTPQVRRPSSFLICVQEHTYLCSVSELFLLELRASTVSKTSKMSMCISVQETNRIQDCLQPDSEFVVVCKHTHTPHTNTHTQAPDDRRDLYLHLHHSLSSAFMFLSFSWRKSKHLLLHVQINGE